MSNNPRYKNASQRIKVRNRLRSMGMPCALCGQPIDYALPAGDPMSFEVDEIVPISLGGSPTSMDNVQPAHRICNQRKGNRIAFTCEGPGLPGHEVPKTALNEGLAKGW